MEHKPKISMAEVIIVGLLFLITDLIAMPLALLGLNGLVGAIRFPLSFFYIKVIKKMATAAVVASGLASLMPVFGAAFVGTIGWGFIVAQDRNPKIATLAEKVPGAH